MDNKFTEQIGQWLNTPETERDYNIETVFTSWTSGNQIINLNNRAD